MFRRHAYSLLIASLVFSGCVAVFRHETLPATVTITEQATGHVLAGVSVSVNYIYDGYQYIYVFNRPRDAEATTDADGRATIPVADFKYGTILTAAYARLELMPGQVRTGGNFVMENMGTLNKQKPTLVLGLQRPAQ